MKKASLLALTLLATAIFAAPQVTTPASSTGIRPIPTVPGMPPVVNPLNLYSETGANMFNPVVKEDLERVYVPNLRSNDVTDLESH